MDFGVENEHKIIKHINKKTLKQSVQKLVGNLSKKWCILGRLGEPQLAKKALKNDAKKTSKKLWKKRDAGVR